jgi:uncharacterized protein
MSEACWMKRELSRRSFLAGVGAATFASSTAASLSADTEHKPVDELEEFEYGAVQLTGGPLKRQYDRVHASYLALDNDRLLKVYRERAGMPAPGEEMGGWYGADGFIPGHSLGQYISGLARLDRATGDAACQQKVHELVEGFAATFDTRGQIYAGVNSEKLWPCYVLDKHLAGLLDAYNLSGVEQALDLLPRVFRAALQYIPERGRDRIGKRDPPYDETYVLPENLFATHALTGERAFYDRARAYLLDREFFDPLAEGQDVLPSKHAYSHAIALSSAAKARVVLGDPKYLPAMQNAWQFLVNNQQYASGGWGPNEQFIEPHKGQLYQSLHTTADHFETPCGSYAATKLARSLLCATADGRYGDGLERVTWNAILAVKEPDSDGDYPYYSTYSGRARKEFYPKKWPCCSGTLVQCVADYVKNIYFRSPDGVVVNLYASSRLQWKYHSVPVTLTQVTEYPLDEVVSLRIDCSEPATFSLGLRIPTWCSRSPAVKVNGKPASIETRRGFAYLLRRWNLGDTITLELPQHFRTEAVDDLHPDTVAMMRGPLLYAELNPTESEARLAQLDSMKLIAGSNGLYSARDADRTRVYAPFCFVRDESYSVYFDKK